jgi:hypothetical protein
MQLLELVGRRSGVARLMLTVFHGNTGAVQLYRKLGWVGGAGMVGRRNGCVGGQAQCAQAAASTTAAATAAPAAGSGCP